MIVPMTAVALLVTRFLSTINGFLRGSSTLPIHLGLAIATTVELGAMCYIKPVYGIAAITCCLFICGPLMRPLAARLAAKIFRGAKRGRYVGLPSKRLAQISSAIGRPRPLPRNQKEFTVFSGDKSRGLAIDALIKHCQGLDGPHAVIERHGVDEKELIEIFNWLFSNGAGQWAGGHYVAASALAYSESLEFAIVRFRKENPRSIETTIQILYYFERGIALEGAGVLGLPKFKASRSQFGAIIIFAYSIASSVAAYATIPSYVPDRPYLIAGYGMSNLAYALFIAAAFSCTLSALGLKRRSHVFAAGGVAYAAGFLLSNV